MPNDDFEIVNFSFWKKNNNALFKTIFFTLKIQFLFLKQAIKFRRNLLDFNQRKLSFVRNFDIILFNKIMLQLYLFIELLILNEIYVIKIKK